MTKIKFCGMMCEADIKAANEIKPDFVGFVFAPKSKRCVSRSSAEKLKSMLDPSIKAVGVFVDAPVADVAQLVRDNVIDVIQLHGSENECFVEELKNELNGLSSGSLLNQSRNNHLGQVPIIKACRANSAQDIKETIEFPCDYLLFDNGPGGTGKNFDWAPLKETMRPSNFEDPLESKASRCKLQKLANNGCDFGNPFRPYFLAGGLDAQNVAKAISELHPYAVDVSSGIETEGTKDIQKMKAFAAAVRKDEK